MLGADDDSLELYLSDEAQNELAFTGFFGPVSNPPYTNTIARGQRVHITFELGGYRGMRVLDAGFPLSHAVDCRTWERLGPDEAAVLHGQLTFSPVTTCYSFIWQTDAAWGYGCRAFVLGLRDGSRHTAYFRLR